MSRRGKVLETRLAGRHELYWQRGVARIHKVHPEARNVKGRIVYSGKGPPDFIGVLADGRSVCFDAKESTTGKSFRLELVPPHQAQDLEAHAMLGGLAFFVVRTTAGEWMVPWRSVAEGYWTKTLKSISPAALDMLGTRIEGCDWLAAVETP